MGPMRQERPTATRNTVGCHGQALGACLCWGKHHHRTPPNRAARCRGTRLRAPVRGMPGLQHISQYCLRVPGQRPNGPKELVAQGNALGIAPKKSTSPYSSHVGYPQPIAWAHFYGPGRLSDVDNQPAWETNYGFVPSFGLDRGNGRTISPRSPEDRFQPVRRCRIPIQSRSNAALRAPHL
jgi:hypothetical protein